MKDSDKLYNLLPAVYREIEARSQQYPLRDLLRLVTEQAEIVDHNIEQLWNNFFIETCDRWAVPYIGDLVGNNLLHDTSRIDTPDTAHELFPDLMGRDLRPPIAVRNRVDVAKTIYYRRRKGTLPMLEELARDVTGWATHAVAFFELLNTTQNLNHLRLQSLDCPDLRRVEPLDRLNGPFDTISHTVDVRPIGQDEGWYNIKNIGFFLWRLNSYPLENVPARKAGKPWQYHFSPLGNPAPLFTRLRREGDEAGMASELHVPGPIRHTFFYKDLQSLAVDSCDHSELYCLFETIQGNPLIACSEPSLFIFLNGIPILPAVVTVDPSTSEKKLKYQIVCSRLAKDPENDDWDWPGTQPSGNVIAVDVETGRLAVGDGWGVLDQDTKIDVYFHYGFSSDLGGGFYDRQKWLVKRDMDDVEIEVYEVKEGGTTPQYPDLLSAIDDWINDGRKNAIITILDSRNYDLPKTLMLSNTNWLVIEAAIRQRPVLKTEATGLEIEALSPSMPNSSERSNILTFNGVVIEGFIEVSGDLGRLRVLHSTLVPGRCLKEDGAPETNKHSLLVKGKSGGKPINTSLRVEIAFSITGPLRLPEDAEGLWLLDSIIDGVGETAISKTNTSKQYGPPATIERSTIFGGSYVKKLPLASESIFTEPVSVKQLQKGCIRFSYVPKDSKTPRRYRCQPDLEMSKQIKQAEEESIAAGTTLTQVQKDLIRSTVQTWLTPSFTNVHYGLPGYAQLRHGSPVQIRTGAEDGSEMGVFCHLKQPQRETNLRIRLEEYLPFGLDAGFMYVT